MTLISPYGGSLVDLVVPAEEKSDLARYAATLPSLQISPRSQCDLELLATGAFSPLDTFMSRVDYDRVVGDIRLGNGLLFPIPITLPVGADAPVSLGLDIALRTTRNEILAVMTVEEIYPWDRDSEARCVFGTTDRKHPLVAEMESWGGRNVSGRLRVLSLPKPFEFCELRRTPSEVREKLEEMGHGNVVAFQTRNPMHRAHEELTKRAIAAVDGTLLLHPAVGMTQPGDVDQYTRIRTYIALTSKDDGRERVLLSLLPLAMRMAGPREALWHAIIRRNYGANHFIVGRDHASPGADSRGRPFYGAYDARDLVTAHSKEIGVAVVPFDDMVYVPAEERFEEASKVPSGVETLSLSGTRVRDDYLGKGVPLPAWFTRPEVAAILADAYPPKHRQGVCVWFTGLPASGKSTTAEIVAALLLERGRRSTLLDGDVVRTHLSKGLGFSKEDRDANILRIGFVASEIVRHGGVAICAAVSPYRAARDSVRAMVGAGHFVEVFVATPLELCEARDTKGLYAQARSGRLRHFTGVDDPYEEPFSPEIVLETERAGAVENARKVIETLASLGFVK